VDKVIAEEVTNLYNAFHEEKSLKKKARVAAAYLLMGAPSWVDIVRAKLRNMKSPLSLSLDRR
jgi:hypothetical protein